MKYILTLALSLSLSATAATSTIEALTDATTISASDKVWMVDVDGTPADVDATLEQIVSPFAADPSSNSAFDAAEWAADLNITSAWGDITSTPTTLSGYGITDAATSAQGDTADSAQQPATTLGGYGIADAYTKSESDASYDAIGAAAAVQSDVDQNETDADAAIALKADASAVSNVDNTSDANKPVSIATQTVLNSAAATTVARLNPKAFAGGVAISSATTSTIVGSGPIPIGTSDFSFGFSVLCNDWAAGFAINLFSAAMSPAGQTETLMFGPTSNATQWRIFFGTSTSFNVAYDWTQHNGSEIAVSGSADRSGNFTLYINGVSVGAVDLSSVQATNYSSTEVWRLIPDGDFSGYLKDFNFFNTTLSATHAAEIYAQGINGWLAANPEYKWGNPAPLTNGAFSNIGGSWDTFSGTSANGFTGVNTASDGRAQSALTISNPLSGQQYRVDYDLTVNSGGGVQFLLAKSGGSGASNSTSVVATGVGSVILISDSNDIATLRVNAIGNTDIVLTGVSITKLGCTTSLPMDEGVGYQLHDQSTNHNDALLSETGAEHLQPKQAGLLRGFGLDADANDYLASASTDLIPADCVITDIQIIDQGSEAATGLTVELSDGSNHNALHTGLTLSADAAISTAATAEQITTDRRLRMSTSTGGTNVDVRVNFKRVNN